MLTKLVSIDLLAHPIRLEILRFLVTHNTASPKMMADEMGIPVENVAYHVRKMAKSRAIRPARRRTVRGAIEHFYRLDHARTSVMVNELRALATELEDACADPDEWG